MKITRISQIVSISLFISLILFATAEAKNIRISHPDGCHFFQESYIDTIPVWPKTYGGNLSTGGDDIDETYDYGYLITGNIILPSGLKHMGILLKTDINGEIIWEKRIGSFSYDLSINDSYVTDDGGIVTIGTSMKLDEYGDAVILKLDACGNMEWCKLYSVPDDVDAGIRIIQLSNGNYLAQINYFGYDNAYKRVWLFCLDPGGDLIWQKVYCTGNPELAHSFGWDLKIASNDSFIISGTTAIEYPVGSGLWWWEPLLVKTDQDGEEIFARAFMYDKTVYYGLGYRVTEDCNGNFLVSSKNYFDSLSWSSPGAIVRFDADGKGLNWMNLWAPMYWGGTCTTVDFISPDSMIVTGGYAAGFDSAYAIAYLMDTSGQVLDEKILKYDPDGNVIRKTILTSDQKALMTATFWNGAQAKCDMFLYKMNYGLEYDTLDPRTLSYDSLCPDLPIISDTIDPDCDIIVGLEDIFRDPEKSRLKIVPNPAQEQVTITLPDVWLSEFSSPGIQIQTANYTYPENLHIEMFDSFGRLACRTELLNGNKTVVIDLRGWEPGLYIVRVLAETREIGSEKLIIH